MGYDPDTQLGGSSARFPTTHPSLLEQSRNGPEALGQILERYWKPVYKYIRMRWGHGNEEAKDLTQGFFTVLLERDLIEKFDSNRASFRTYLRTCIDGFVKNQRESVARIKRGGGVPIQSLDFEGVENEIAATSLSPEEYFERECQRENFTAAVEALKQKCGQSGKSVHWQIFQAYDLADGARPAYEELAHRHGIPVTTVTNYLAWARRELRRRLEP